MRLIDSNGVLYILQQDIVPTEVYFLVPDVEEELEMAELRAGKKIPKNITSIGRSPLYDECIYLSHYQACLNSFGGRSFYNMKGFGDISILACLEMIMSIYARQRKSQLFDTSEVIEVYTDDEGLKKRITKTFSPKEVVVLSAADIN